MAPASIFSLALVIYTGFTIPTKIMHPWLRWLNYLNPVAYAFESLMINEVRLLNPYVSAGPYGRLVPQSYNPMRTICSARSRLW